MLRCIVTAISLPLTFVMCLCFLFNDTATTELYTLSLHDALPISALKAAGNDVVNIFFDGWYAELDKEARTRSEEHTSELQSHVNLVCRLLLEKKNTIIVI